MNVIYLILIKSYAFEILMLSAWDKLIKFYLLKYLEVTLSWFRPNIAICLKFISCSNDEAKKCSDSFINKKCHFFIYFIYLIALLHAIFCLFLLVALSRNYQRYRQKLPWRNLKNCMYWVDVSGRCSCKRTHIQTIFFPGKLIFIISNFH